MKTEKGEEEQISIEFRTRGGGGGFKVLSTYFPFSFQLFQKN